MIEKCLILLEINLIYVLFFLQDKESMIAVLRAVDKAGGYIYGPNSGSNLTSSAFSADYEFFRNASVKEKYFSMDTD